MTTPSPRIGINTPSDLRGRWSASMSYGESPVKKLPRLRGGDPGRCSRRGGGDDSHATLPEKVSACCRNRTISHREGSLRAFPACPGVFSRACPCARGRGPFSHVARKETKRSARRRPSPWGANGRRLLPSFAHGEERRGVAASDE